MTLLQPVGRLLLLVGVLAAWLWDAPNDTLRADLLVGLRWSLLLVLVLGFLTVPRQALTAVLRLIALTFIDLRRVFAWLDRPWRHVERAVIILAGIAMTVLTFLSVLHRNFNGRVSGSGVNWLGMTMDPHPGNGDAMRSVALLWLGLFVVIVFATMRALRGRHGQVLRVAIGLVLAIAFYGASRLFVSAVPNNIPGALTMSLGALLYLSFFGAAVAAGERKHLSVDAVRKAVPEGLQPLFAFLGQAGGAAFCAFLAVLGTMQVWSDYQLWAGNHALKVYESVPLPYWTVRLAIPVGLGVAALRLAGHAFDDLWWGLPEDDDNAAIASSGVKLDQKALEEALAEIGDNEEDSP